jgi:hypothetical protein
MAAWNVGSISIFLVNMGVDSHGPSSATLIVNHNKNIHRYHSRPQPGVLYPESKFFKFA